MSLKIFDHSANYTATVIKLPVKQKVEGLDNLVMVEVFGNKCLIGKDSDESLTYLFFPSGTQLSSEFLHANNLYRESQLNSNADPLKKGFFEPNGRVKAIKFRGIVSSGFVIPISSLFWESLPINGGHSFKEGDEFNEIDGVEICRKYMLSQPSAPGTKADRASKLNEKMSGLLIPNQFRFHTDTAHLAKHLKDLKPSDIILITDKWHGSSAILARVMITKKLTFWQKLLNKIGGQIPTKDYGYIYSSGKPKSNLPKGIEGEWINDGPDFYTSNIWKEAFEKYKHALEDGISIYGEIVGYEKDSASFIQKGYDYGCLPFSTGEIIHYTRNIDGYDFDHSVKAPPQNRFVVYRVTYTKPNGEVIEFTWQQIKDYCKKYDLETVKEIYFGRARDYLEDWYGGNERFGEAFFQYLQMSVEGIGGCVYCENRVPAEGVVVRKDGGPAYKLKASSFLAKESTDADKGETNIEDNA